MRNVFPFQSVRYCFWCLILEDNYVNIMKSLPSSEVMIWICPHFRDCSRKLEVQVLSFARIRPAEDDTESLPSVYNWIPYGSHFTLQ